MSSQPVTSQPVTPLTTAAVSAVLPTGQPPLSSSQPQQQPVFSAHLGHLREGRAVCLVHTREWDYKLVAEVAMKTVVAAQ
eukprot:229475-Prorocentrum_minimum.AAC.1